MYVGIHCKKYTELYNNDSQVRFCKQNSKEAGTNISSSFY